MTEEKNLGFLVNVEVSYEYDMPEFKPGERDMAWAPFGEFFMIDENKENVEARRW
jgi:Na+-transporting NADH:ubiquinone oxidoreductase subunit NqrF